jgi:hypothetical protein
MLTLQCARWHSPTFHIIFYMPTVLKIGPYRFFFYSNENSEPAHIHIQRESMLAKFWLRPVALASSIRFAPQELRTLEKLVVENRDTFTEAWNDYFNR